MSTLLSKTGIGQLTSILEGHMQAMQAKNDTVDKIIDGAKTAGSLRDAKRKALENEKALLLSIMEDIDEMNSFLKNIILIENLFNQKFQPYKQQQEKARATYASNISKYESKPKVQSKANSFVELIFGGQTHVSSFQTWIDKVVKECKTQNVKIITNSGAQVKKIERAFYKAFYVYSEQDGYKEMTDILRCSLVFNDFNSLYQCFSIIERLILSDDTTILRVKDRFHPHTIPFGYRDLLINIFCPQSPIIAEIQLHFIEFYKYKTISHKMYKRARLFDRDDCNKAYDYATKFLRPKIGASKVYKVSKDEMEDDKNEELISVADMKYDVLLKEWGLAKYIGKMQEEGWDDPADWKEIEDGDLKDDIGFNKGHIKKFRRKYGEWLKRIDEEKNRVEEKNDIAIYQEQVYGNQQPKLQLEQEMKRNDSRPATNIGQANTKIVGRDRDLNALVGFLDNNIDAMPVTIIYGRPKIGLTTVGLQVGRFFMEPSDIKYEGIFLGGIFRINVQNCDEPNFLYSYIGQTMGISNNCGTYGYWDDKNKKYIEYNIEIQKELHGALSGDDITDPIEILQETTHYIILDQHKNHKELLQYKLPKIMYKEFERKIKMLPMEFYIEENEVKVRRIKFTPPNEESILKEIKQYGSSCDAMELQKLLIIDHINFPKPKIKQFLQKIKRLVENIKCKLLLICHDKIESVITQIQQQNVNNCMLKQRLWRIQPISNHDSAKLLLEQARQLYEFDFTDIKTPSTAEETGTFPLFEWLSKSPGLIQQCSTALDRKVPFCVIIQMLNEKPNEWVNSLDKWKEPLKLQQDEVKDAINALTALLTEINVVKEIWSD